MSGFQEDQLNGKARNQEDISFGSESDEGKKKLVDSAPPPGISKTLHVRNLPPDTSEQDIIQIALPFGRVINVLLLNRKNQAWVQMADLQSTAALTQYYSSVRANIRGKPIFFQYSTRDEIIANQTGPEQQNHILLVTIQNLLYPVDIDILYRVFSKYGAILKVVIFNKNAGFQSLIQFSDVQAAIAAKMELDGQNIYSGCCTLRIQFSSLANLNVKYNNDKSRDFSNPNLPSTPSNSMNSNNSSLPLGAPDSSIYSSNWMNTSNPMGGYSYPYPNSMGKSPMSTPIPGANMPSQIPGGSCVLIVSGLDTERVSPDHLFTLFGVYGDVVRIKILHNKRDTSLVQFVSSQQAETALNHLNGCPLNGNPLKVNFSKHSSISHPKQGVEAEGVNLTKDFTGSPLHRYKVAGSRNYQHICPPSAVLHCSNIPESASEDIVRELFSQSGTVAGFRFFPKDRRMGLVQMASVGEAVSALINVHNYVLDGSNLRVSFSKSTL